MIDVCTCSHELKKNLRAPVPRCVVIHAQSFESRVSAIRFARASDAERPRLAGRRRTRRHRAGRVDRQRRVPSRSGSVRRHGLSLLWVTLIAVLQTIFNTELMRYTLATGEPVFTGFMRTRPSSTLWAWLYVVLYFLQVGWPAWAGTAAGAIFFLGAQRPPVAADATASTSSASQRFWRARRSSVGRRIEHTLEVLNWILVVRLGGFLVLTLLFVPAPWMAAALGLSGFDRGEGRFDFLPAGADFFLLGALVAYSGAAACRISRSSNWARDHGYGMGERAGYIPAAIGGAKVHLAHSGFSPRPTPNRCAGGRAGGGSCARISGVCSSPAPLSAWCCPRCFTSRSFRRGRIFRDSASAPLWRRAWVRTPAPLVARLRFPRRVDSFQDAARQS